MQSTTIKRRFMAVAALFLLMAGAAGAAPPFGGGQDVAFARALWQALASVGMVGDRNPILSRPYRGKPPHGKILDLLERRVVVNGFNGVAIVKKNYGGEGLTVNDVIDHPREYLKSVTVMFKRGRGYDPENRDWFYVKYAPDGAILKNPKGMLLAGRVAKGKPTGCIACHRTAPGGDFVFNHDRYR